jgi:membrane fusion protein (multidrug efflux system)
MGDDATAKLASAAAEVKLAKAELTQAQLELQYTQIKAATDGWITNMSLREGNIATANQPLFALISSQEFWVDANFKETELQQIKPGQKAMIEVDMYPGHKFIGKVDSISAGSGTAFSLLPPQNATGNWVKITQRVPVRIHIENLSLNYPLRIGTTASVIIDLYPKHS